MNLLNIERFFVNFLIKQNNVAHEVKIFFLVEPWSFVKRSSIYANEAISWDINYTLSKFECRNLRYWNNIFFDIIIFQWGGI